MDLLTSVGTYVVPFLIILTVVVFVHELGHYLLARLNGVRVQVFSIGFGPELFGVTDRAGTRWKVSAVPLGGYVKMHGDADATSSTIDLSALPDPDSFPAKTVWQRMAIVVAGPGANFVFAMIALALLFATVGRPFTPAEVGEVQAGSPAEAAGLIPGDRILAVDGEELESFEQLQGIVRGRPEEVLTFTIGRDGDRLEVPITPQLAEIEDRFGQIHRIGLIGVSRSGVEFKRSNPVFAVVEGVSETFSLIGATLHALGEMVVGSRTTEDLGGPLRIAQMSGEIAKDGAVPMIWFTAVLSINLGLINLFPIPMLDGGHLVMYGIEAARGRPLTERSQEVAFRFGLALVITLMMVATWNDLIHLNVIEFFKGLAS
ncbi:MAG TPA: RIP metalloprotease RseP [Geminicoccaceae bacterium]|nr:RIP metalloprotease RseP [Geminicoccaceae bacterium]